MSSKIFKKWYEINIYLIILFSIWIYLLMNGVLFVPYKYYYYSTAVENTSIYDIEILNKKIFLSIFDDSRSAIPFRNRQAMTLETLIDRETEKIKLISIVIQGERGNKIYEKNFNEKILTLKKYILENRIKNGKMRINHILEIFFKIAEVVCKIHKKGIIHCDLKPSNILIDIRGNIRIIDFGASLKKKEKIELVKISEGYSPIEIYSEKVEIDERTDVYSLAALLYFMLCGVKVDGAIKRFYKAELEFGREVILGFEKVGKFKEVEEVIKKGLEFDRQKRFGSVREMIEKLRKIIA